MKKTLLGMVSICGLSMAFVSCNHDVETLSKDQIVEREYNAAFVREFGQPAGNQDWGFSSRQLPVNFGTTTRAAQPNGNQWGKHDDNDKYLLYPAPAAITASERDSVLEVFSQKGEQTYESLVDWKNFFVQQVYTGPNGSKMNELATTVDYEVRVNVTCYWPYQADTSVVQVNPYDDIINNFNAGNCTAWDGCMLMWNSATKDFSYKTSQGGGERWYRHWRMEKINGNFYVGFDHESAKQGSDANENELDVRDYIYNDWIVKIVPGYGETIPEDQQPNRYTVRMIAEDLTASTGSDFDFNDVVFDASYVDGSNTTTVTVQAAGGTLPLYVAGKEVHELFAAANPNKGISVRTMINTNASNGISGLDPVTFTIDHIVAPWDIVVTVMKDGVQIPLKAETGSPAAKIAVDPDFIWCDEREDIRQRYPNFTQYVQDTTVNWY